jgi:hypothetical protein
MNLHCGFWRSASISSHSGFYSKFLPSISRFKASSVLTMALMAASYMPLLSSTVELSESRELTHPVEQKTSLKYNFLRRTRDPKGQGFYFARMQPGGRDDCSSRRLMSIQG